MKNLVKLKVILLIFSIVFASKSIAADRILPIPKPQVDQETKIITAKKKEIYPEKKPEIKKGKVEIDKSDEIEEVKAEEEIIIFPKKKPITVKTTIDKAVAKSLILSKKRF